MASKNVDEESQLLNIFPNEVWCLILEEVKEAPDYHNISSASSLFRTLLQPRSPHILFPEVAKVLLEQLPPDWREKVWDGDYFIKKCPVPFLPLREVCRSSRKAVDGWLQTLDFQASERSLESLRFRPKCIMEQERGFDEFERADEFGTFEGHFDPTHLCQGANPFKSRGIILHFPSFVIEPLEPYSNACVQLLTKYGHHLWYCRLYFHCHPDHYIQIFQTILELMPNLRVFLVDGAYDDPEIHVTIPLPSLEHLHTICVKNLSRGLFRGLLQNNFQVRLVDVGGTPHLAKLALEMLPNLTAACFDLDRGNELSAQAFEVFSSARVEFPRLERLWLSVCKLRVPLNSIVREVESKFGDSLTQLELHLPICPNTEFGGALVQELRLSNLKILKLILHDPEELDFVVGLKDTLEQLSIQCEDTRSLAKMTEYVFLLGMNGREFDKTRFRGDLAQFPIWAHFPKLAFLQLRRVWRGCLEPKPNYTCTRSKWEASKDAH